MDKWISYAFISMLFAGFTSVIAKAGLVGISGELGLVIRTLFVCGFIGLFAVMTVPLSDLNTATHQNFWWLGLSGVTTSFSWIFYYKALKAGDVATVALIDKGSVVVAMLLAWFMLKETITLRMLIGAAFIVVGLFIIARK